MIRVYFDWNIFTNLKLGYKNPYNSINHIIENYKDNVIFPYSPVHLSDLKRGYSESALTRQKTSIDLELLHRISLDHCFYFESKIQNVITTIYNPVEYFEEMVKANSDFEFDLESFLATDDSNPISQLLGGHLNYMKAIQTGIDLKSIATSNQMRETLAEMFPNLSLDDSIYNLLKDVSNIIGKPEFFSSIYKSIRNTSVTDMKINTNPLEWGNPIEYLDKILVKSGVNKTFRELIETTMSTKTDTKSHFDYFIKYYISLDTFGYHRDSKLPNLIDDATHAFYGAHCDFFVTEDNNTYHKAKAVFENFNISTQVVKAAEFPSAFYAFNEFGLASKTLTDRLVEIIKHSLVIKKSIDDKLNTVEIHKITPPLVNFFNRMQTTHFDDSTSLYLYKKQDNYSRSFFWSEIKSIVDKIVFEMGIDDNLKAEFDVEQESSEIIEGKWLGRKWDRGFLITEIIYEEFGPVLRLSVSQQY
jgi:hypothetical protein